MNMQAMMKQAQKMQSKLLTAQQEIEASIFPGESGSGKVKLELTGKGELRSLKIDRSVVDPEDVELLEDLLLTAFRQAKNAADARSQALMSEFKMPGLPF